MQQILSNAAQATATALYWVGRNAVVAGDLKNQQDDLSVTLARTTSSLLSSIHNLKQRPTIGLFGASQAGKSYLVSALAAGRNARLQTHWDQDAIDFIRHVNPSGNNSEATGFVTRFTHVKHPTPVGYPVELALLSELEIVMILVNAFFNDINQADVKVPHDESYFLQHLDRCAHFVDQEAYKSAFAYREFDDNAAKHGANGAVGSAAEGGYAGASAESGYTAGYTAGHTGGNTSGDSAGYTGFLPKYGEYNYITPAQVVELADFVGTNSNGKLGSIADFPEFWSRLRDMLPYMPLAGRVETLSILWQQLPIFNETYRTLAFELLKVHGASVIYAPREAFVCEKNGSLMQNESGTIMHITKLATMFSDTTTLNCAVLGAPGAQGTVTGALGGAQAAGMQLCSLNVSRLAALSLELRFNLEAAGNLDEFDVLDLPGARSRDVVLLKDVIDDGRGFDGKTLSAAMQLRGSEFFRRGKVAFLFDRYARKNEIEQLLFCIGVNAQQDVTSVLTILSDWVDHNVGTTPQQRAMGYNPLTIILTRYDEVFNRQLKNMDGGLPLDMNQELNIALNRIQKLNWFNEWTPGKPFDRILLARKPGLGELNAWIESDPQTNQELAITPDEQAKLEQICAMLLDVDDFKLHIHDMAGCLKALLELNDGGVTRIAQTIRANSLDNKRRDSLRTYKACHAVQECVSLLSPFATRDSGLALEKAQHDGLQLSLQLMQCNFFAPCFNLFRPLLEISETRLEEIYQQGFTMGSNVARFVKAVMNEYTSNLSELMRKDNVQLNAIADLVARSYARWKANIESDPQNIEYFSVCYDTTEQRFKRPDELKDDVVSLFNRIVSEISKTFGSSQVGMQKYMNRRLLEQENVNEGFVDIVRVQVQLMSLMLSDFNMYLGSNLLPATATTLAQKRSSVNAPNAQPAQNSSLLGGSIVGSPQAMAQAAASAFNAYAPGQGPVAGRFAPSSGFGSGFGGFDQAPDEDDDFSDLALDTPDAYSNQASGANMGNYDPAGYGSANYGQAGQSGQTGYGAMGYGAVGPGGAHGGNPAVGDLGAPVTRENSVLGTSEGPCNSFYHVQERIGFDGKRKDYQVFCQQCAVDDTKVLPHLNAASADYEFKFISDFCATLMYMMCRINVLQASKYQFSAKENLLLCHLLNLMESCESCQS